MARHASLERAGTRAKRSPRTKSPQLQGLKTGTDRLYLFGTRRMTPAVRRTRCVAVLVAAGVSFGLIQTVPDATAQNPRAAAARDCLMELSRGRSPDFACTWPAALRDKEREDLKRLTQNNLQDARCAVAVKIERRIVMEALDASDFVFQSPPQPVDCEIEMKGGQVVPITATFSPRVVFKDGQAVDGTPGLSNIKGVNGYLAWPVEHYVNRAPGVKKEMLRMINLYRERRAAAIQR